ncbi:hypothetical protein WJX77_000712 [Trebouxia sp. C0004]
MVKGEVKKDVNMVPLGAPEDTKPSKRRGPTAMEELKEPQQQGTSAKRCYHGSCSEQPWDFEASQAHELFVDRTYWLGSTMSYGRS